MAFRLPRKTARQTHHICEHGTKCPYLRFDLVDERKRKFTHQVEANDELVAAAILFNEWCFRKAIKNPAITDIGVY